jgi:hypothetical protein
METKFDTSQVDALAAAEEKETCGNCIYFKRLPCLADDWETRDANCETCGCFEVEGGEQV